MVVSVLPVQLLDHTNICQVTFLSVIGTSTKVMLSFTCPLQVPGHCSEGQIVKVVVA